MFYVTCWAADGRSRTVSVRAASETAACRLAVAELIAETGDGSWVAGVVL